MKYINKIKLFSLLLSSFMSSGVFSEPIKPGGEGSVDFKPFASFVLPMKNLTPQQLKEFHAGKALAHQPWVKAPSSTTARDGLGPLYNARTCLACHINGGRGVLPIDNKQRLTQGIVRLSIENIKALNSTQRQELATKGVLEEPNYGEQLQTQSVALAHQLGLSKFADNEVKPEANVFIDWQTSEFNYPDGTRLNLRKPIIRYENLAYGDFHKGIKTSFRNAPALIGVGLLEQISNKDIMANVEKQKANNEVSGRVNFVWDPKLNKTEIGRFGWKANKPSVLVQTAAAFQADIGISNSIFAKQPCQKNQKNCQQQISGDDKEGHEINDKLLELVAHFTRNIAVPYARSFEHDPEKTEQLNRGQKLFSKIGCADCHRPSYVTKTNRDFPQLSSQSIWPYTDLLLHDMGEGLADGRKDYLATGREWKTPALWGIGLSKKVNGSALLLHDGRATSVEEAIIWHGGEAKATQQRFVNLPKSQREALINFVNTL